MKTILSEILKKNKIEHKEIAQHAGMVAGTFEQICQGVYSPKLDLAKKVCMGLDAYGFAYTPEDLWPKRYPREIMPPVENSRFVMGEDEKLVEKALRGVSRREAHILVERTYFGETLISLAKKHKVTKERIRQIQMRAYEKIKMYIIKEDELCS